ncbi:MAG: hypothetical protein AAFY38_16230 [Pseudomonadota bacterium]
MRYALIACVLSALAALPATARELTVLVQRGAGSTQLFLSAPADDLFALTATPVDLVPGGGGQVDTTTFTEGTWAIGDALLARTDAQIGAAPASFEAMSFMLHGTAEEMPLNTPLDALIAIELCSVAEPGQTQDWADLIAYAGYFSTAGSEGAAITLNLPADRPTPVRVIDAGAAGQVSWTTTLQPGAPLRIEPPASQRAAFWPFGVLAMLGAAGLVGIWRVLRVRRG